MEIISWNFIGFAAATLLVYYLLPRRAQNYWLLAASYFFYINWDYRFAFILILTTLINFFVASHLWVNDQKQKHWLWVGIMANVLGLVIFHLQSSGYAYKLINYFARLGGISQSIDLEIFLPIGFSFYALQAISYLVDVYQKRLPASRDIIDFALYMSYFPKMVSGPIERARSFLPKLSQERRVDNAQLERSFTLIIIGLVRKLLLAETFGRYIPTDLFTSPTTYTIPTLFMEIVLYGFWLYNDFAGYTSIVRGISGLFGIELSPNFQQPYFSRNFVEFWNRWHITLSHWLRDYIYFPISRALLRRIPNHNNPINIILPPVITMLISGLWHNFGFYMIVWGGLHGVYQILERIIAIWKPTLPPEKQPVWQQGLHMLVTFTLTVFAWVAFGSGSLSKALLFWKALFTSPGTSSYPYWMLFQPAFMLLICILLDWLQYHYKDENVFVRWTYFAKSSLLALIIIALFFNLLWGDVMQTSFVYQGF
jgi:D-alanyl-lipoteichoic acid acyltransferase DltB (MBOAT superfamily)